MSKLDVAVEKGSDIVVCQIDTAGDETSNLKFAVDKIDRGIEIHDVDQSKLRSTMFPSLEELDGIDQL